MDSLPVHSSPSPPERPDHPVTPQVTFWQKPVAQRVVPFVSSIFLHLVILCVGLIFYTAVQIVRSPNKVQLTVPDASMGDQAAGGNMHPGVNRDDLRDAAQDQVPNVDSGTATKQPSDLAATLETPGAPPQGASSSALSSLQKASEAAGAGGESGPRGPFGVPGGGGALGPKASFLGVGGNGRRIVFILDASGSMAGNSDAVRDRVSDAIDVLRPPQSFNLLFINDHNIPPPSPKLLFVNPENKRLAKGYMKKIEFRGGTDPLPPLRQAFAMRPDLIYFLIDPGDFPDKQAVLDLVRQNAGGGRTTMNIIAFEHHDEENERFLKQLADETHGVFAFKTVKELQEAN